MPKDPNLQELNDSKRELSKELRQALKLATAKAIDHRTLSRSNGAHHRRAGHNSEEIALMLKEQEAQSNDNHFASSPSAPM